MLPRIVDMMVEVPLPPRQYGRSLHGVTFQKTVTFSESSVCLLSPCLFLLPSVPFTVRPIC